MKFVRFGPLTPQKQTQYKEPVPDMWPSSPPGKKGFFAFPAGYMDPFYLPLSRPPEEPHSLLQYLRDDDGNKVTKREMYADDEEKTLSAEGEALLKKRKLKLKQIFWVERPSWVMFYPDPEKDLTFYGLGTEDEDRTRLNQPLEFLLDPSGDKLDARDLFSNFFFHDMFPGNYEGWYDPPVPDKDFYPDDEELHYPDGTMITLTKWLKKKNIRTDQLCLWPCYAKGEDEYAATLKKYRVFDYEGCLWHHLGMFLKNSEIISRFSDIWCYTDIRAYERALKKSNSKAFGKKQDYQRKTDSFGYFGAHEYNGTFDQSTMYEVFFDQKIP